MGGYDRQILLPKAYNFAGDLDPEVPRSAFSDRRDLFDKTELLQTSSSDPQHCVKMADRDKNRGFGDIEKKLSQPAKKSAFERQREEAEAKRREEEAQAARVLEDFAAEHGVSDDDADKTNTRPQSTFPSGPRTFGGPPVVPSRPFPPSGPRTSGVGAHEQSSDTFTLDETDRENVSSQRLCIKLPKLTLSKAPRAVPTLPPPDSESDANQKTVKPAFHITPLPLGTSSETVKDLIPASLKVDNIKFRDHSIPSGPATSRQCQLSAVVVLAEDTKPDQLSAAEASLQNRYVGKGCFLSVTKTEVITSPADCTDSAFLPVPRTEPFGAQIIPPTFPATSYSHAPPPPSYGSTASPTGPYGYGPAAQGAGLPVQVVVEPPNNLSELRLIHRTIQNVLTHGMEFESLLMDNPEVQQDEQWAFLWNPRSVGGRWYRWRLFELNNRKAGMPPPHKMFDNAAIWRRPVRKLRFEDCTKGSDMIGHPDDDPDNENGWDEDEVEEDVNGDMVTKKGGREYLDPYRIGLLWMLIRELPDTQANLIEGDVKSITDFALIHAEKGALEVVDVLVSHIEILYNQAMELIEQSKNKDDDDDDDDDATKDTGESNQLADKEAPQAQNQSHDKAQEEIMHEKADGEAVNVGVPEETSQNLTDDIPKPQQDRKDHEDPSGPIIVAFNVIHDIVTQGKTAGVTRAVHYGEYFQNTFETRELFSRLGRLDRDLNWGRIRADRWKRQVVHFLDLWAEEGAVPHSNRLKDKFENPPLTEEEERLQEERKKEDEAKKRLVRIILDNGEEIWEDIDGEPMEEDDMDDTSAMDEDIDRMTITEEDMEGMRFNQEEDMDGTPMEEEDIDGEPMKTGNNATGLEKINSGEAVHDDSRAAVSRQAATARPTEPVRISFAASRAAKVEVVKPTAPGLFGDEDE